MARGGVNSDDGGATSGGTEEADATLETVGVFELYPVSGVNVYAYVTTLVVLYSAEGFEH